MNSKVSSAISGLAVAVVTALVAFGAVGGEEATAVQGVLLAAVAFFATVGVRSGLPPKK